MLPLGLGVSLWYMWTTTPAVGAVVGLRLQRARDDVGSAPAGDVVGLGRVVPPGADRGGHRGTRGGRTARRRARLVASAPLVLLALAFAALLGVRERRLGGLTLGTEPGRTTEALHSLPELGQHVALAVLAVALGAALGRRVSSLVLALPVLLVFWFTVDGFSWLFGHRSVTPFSVVQVQPVTVPVGPATADPLGFPAHWLLEPPGEFQEGWARLFVSTDLAWWHDGWVLGLALVLLAAAFPGGTVPAILLATGVADGRGVLRPRRCG